MNKKYLLSIIVPTKNREFYVKKFVQNTLSIKDERIQIIIQDNSETNLLKSYFEENINDTRLKYNYTFGTVSFVENFNLALKLSDGDYVIVLGDDDGLNPDIIKVVEWAKINDIEAIKPELVVTYIWPDNKINPGFIEINNYSGKCEYYDPHKELVKLSKNGFVNYLSYDLAKLYHGIIKFECLEKIRKIKGNYIFGLTPDIYSAVSLSMIVKKAVKIDYPLTIPGYCHLSGTADSINGKHTGLLEDAPHLKGHINYKWNDLVPKFYSVETIWAVTAIEAVNDFDKKLMNNYNLLKLFKICSYKYPEFKTVIHDQLKELNKISLSNGKFLIYRWTFLKNMSYNKIKNFIIKIKKFSNTNRNVNHYNSWKIDNIDDIITASIILEKNTIESKINIDNLVLNLEQLAKY